MSQCQQPNLKPYLDLSRSIPTLANSEWGMRFCFLCKRRTRARRIFRSVLRHNSLATRLQGVEPHVVGCHILFLSPRNDAERIVGQRAL